MSALDRELIKWIQSMDLSHPLKNPRRDLGNGFLVAEILSRYDRTVEMHSFDTGSAMSRRLDNWQQIRKLLVNRGCVSVSEEMMDSAIQMRGEGATNILEALYEHLTKKRLQAGKVTAEKKEALAANQDLKAKAVLDTPAFMRPTAAALLRENNDETINRLQRLTGRTNENIINQKNEELLTRHGLIMQAAKEASPERYEPKKPTLRGMNHTTSPNGSSRRQTWGNSTPGGEGGGGSAPSSSRTRQKLVVAKHLDVRVVDESVLATFAAREQQAKEEALKNGFDTSESLPVALSRVVYRILKSYGIVEAVDEGYEELFGEGGDGYNISQFSEGDGLGLLIESTQKNGGGGGGTGDSSNDDDEDDNNKVPTNSSSDTTGGELDVAGTGDYFTKFLVLRERIPLEIKTYVWNSLVSATELATAPTGGSEENGGGGTHRERGSTSSSKSVGVVARNTARLIADRPSEFQHLAVLFSFALGRNASQVALASSLYNTKVHNCSKTNNNSNNEEEDAAFALDCEFVYRFLESVGQSLGDRTSQEDGAVTNATSSARANHHGLNTDSADFATKLLIPQILSAYLLPLGTSYILEWCARLILAYTPVRHASEIRSVMNSLQQALTSKPPSSSQSRGIVVVTGGNNKKKPLKPSSSAAAVGVLNDRYYVVAMNVLSQVLFETITSSGSGGNAGLLYTSLCELNVSVAKEALLGNSQLPSSEDYKFSATATSKASGLHLLRRTILPYDVLAYHQSFAPSLAITSGKEGNNSDITSALSITAVERFRNSNDSGNNSSGGQNNNSNGTSLEGVPALADKLLAVAASLALRGTAVSGIRGPAGLSPTILQEALSNDELYTPTSAASSALRTVTSMISRQLPRFLMLEAAFRAPRDLGVSGTHHILNTEVLEPYQQFMAAHIHQRAVSKNERRAQNIHQLRDAIVAHRRARIEEESQGEATLEEADINEIYTMLTEDDVIEIARLEIPDSEEIAALDNLVGGGDIFANAAGGDTSTEGGRDDGDSEENEDEDAVRMHRFFTGASATGDVTKDCWFGQALTSAAQNDSNWEVRLAALETAAVLKYTAEHFVVEGQLGPEVDAALAALASTEGASSLEMDLDEEPVDVKEKRAILEKAQNALNAAVNFLETVVGRAQESAFIYFDTKTPALRRQSMVAIAPFLQQPPPPSTMVDEDGNILSTPLDNSSSIMASLFVQRIVEDLRATVSASAAIALAHDKDCRNKTKTEASANSVSELIQHLITKNKASDKLRLVSNTMASLTSSSDTITFPLDLRDHPSYSRLDEERLQHSSPTPPPQSNNSNANSDSAVITVGGKVVSVGVCSSILQFVDPLVLAGCVVSHIHHGQTELQAVEELVREEQVYQQATLGSAEVRPGGGDVSADIHAFVSQRTSPVCSTFEIVWLLEAIFTRAVSLSGVTTQLNNLITAVATSASSPPGDENAEGDALDAKSVISTTSTSAVARMAQKQRNKAASPQAASITASINNNPTHQRYRTFLETIDSSSRQGWMRILAEVKSHFLDSVSDPENIQQLPINEPLMQTLDDIGAALQQQFQRDRVETQQRAKELGNGAISEGPSPPDATDLFAHEVQTRCYHVLTKVYRDLKNNNNNQQSGGSGEGAYQPLTPRDEADTNAEKEASVDWLVAML